MSEVRELAPCSPRSYPPALGVASAAAILALVLCLCAGASRAGAPDRRQLELQQGFAGTVRPFLQAYCVSCHGRENPKAQLDLSAFTSMTAAARDYPRLALLLEKLTAKQMPPPDAGRQPPPAQRDAVIAWIRAL